MPLSHTNSNDIVANSVSLCAGDSDDNILELFLTKTDAIQQTVGIPPEPPDTLQKLADIINNVQTFYST